MITPEEANYLVNRPEWKKELDMVDLYIRNAAGNAETQFVYPHLISCTAIDYLRELGYKVDVSINAIRISWGD